MIARRIARWAMALVLATAVAGCGSICNLAEGPGVHSKSLYTVPYGGVVWDAELIVGPHQNASVLSQVLVIIGGVIDLPFCIAVDTLTLPYTIPKALSYPSPDGAAKSEKPSQQNDK
jgi:uncharacterized protein YceK